MKNGREKKPIGLKPAQAVRNPASILNIEYDELGGEVRPGTTYEKARAAKEAREKLRELHEMFRWSPGHEDWRARWWENLHEDEKRTVCALCGVDDSPESVRRSWPSLPWSVRDSVSSVCKKWARLLDPMRFS